MATEAQDDVDRALASMGAASIPYHNFHSTLRRLREVASERHRRPAEPAASLPPQGAYRGAPPLPWSGELDSPPVVTMAPAPRPVSPRSLPDGPAPIAEPAAQPIPNPAPVLAAAPLPRPIEAIPATADIPPPARPTPGPWAFVTPDAPRMPDPQPGPAASPPQSPTNLSPTNLSPTNLSPTNLSPPNLSPTNLSPPNLFPPSPFPPDPPLPEPPAPPPGRAAEPPAPRLQITAGGPDRNSLSDMFRLLTSRPVSGGRAAPAPRPLGERPGVSRFSLGVHHPGGGDVPAEAPRPPAPSPSETPSPAEPDLFRRL